MGAALERLGPRAGGHRRDLWAHLQTIEDFWCSLQEVEPGAVARLAAAGAAHSWEIIFLTQRPATAGATSQIQTQRWLQAHGFDLPSVYVVKGSRGRIAAALELDVVIDDRPANCLDVVTDSTARSLLVWRGDEGSAPDMAGRLRIETVFSIAEAIERLGARRQAPARLFERLRNAVGV